jgi:hypothetical protein
MEVHRSADFGSMRAFVECEQCNRNFYKKDVTPMCGSFKCDYEAKHENEKIGYNANPSDDNSATMQNMVVKMIKDLDTTLCLSNAALKQVI